MPDPYPPEFDEETFEPDYCGNLSGSHMWRQPVEGGALYIASDNHGPPRATPDQATGRVTAMVFVPDPPPRRSIRDLDPATLSDTRLAAELRRRGWFYTRGEDSPKE